MNMRIPLLGRGDHPTIDRDRKNESHYIIFGQWHRQENAKIQAMSEEQEQEEVAVMVHHDDNRFHWADKEINPQWQGKREFAMKGFWLGCCLGFALFRS
jgi:hypothetical protein